MAVLSEQDRKFFMDNGYVIVKQAVPKENAERVVAAIWDCLGKDPENDHEWYTPPKGMDRFWRHQAAGMVEMYHHQSMWDNRQYPRLYQAFAELLGEEKLWVSMDRVNMKPPVRKDHPELDHSFIHWDMDTSNLPSPLQRPMGVQGVLCLADTAADQGGFQCVPEIYRNLEEWIKSQPADRNPRAPKLEGQQIVPVPAEAGDLIIWDRLLPHGNGRNRGSKPRLAQYITMSKAHPGKSREAAIECWRTNRGGLGVEPDPRDWENQTYGKPAELTPLGRKLVGLDSWF